MHAFVTGANNQLLDLGTLPGGTISTAYGVSRDGMVIGEANTTTAVHAFLWTEKNGIQYLNKLVTQGLPPGVFLHEARAV